MGRTMICLRFYNFLSWKGCAVVEVFATVRDWGISAGFVCTGILQCEKFY
jgi:hypothetical protein